MISIIETDYTEAAHRRDIIELLHTYARGIRENGAGLSEKVKENLVDELARRNTVYTVLAYEDGCPAGIVVSVESFSTFAARPVLNIHDVAVAPQFRGRGISKLMLEKTEEIARRIGCCKLTLEVLENNSIALKLYGSFGFNSSAQDPKWGRALFLEKKLP